MDMNYVCFDCCKLSGIDFCGTAINEAGRKSCCLCGTQRPARLMIVTCEGMLVGIARGLMGRLGRPAACSPTSTAIRS